MNPLIIYHSNCTDGFTAAWACTKFMNNCELYPASYGDEPPDVTGRNVFIVDFSYSRDILMQLKEKAESLIVLDHHKTAQKNLEDFDFCIFNMDKSGARLTWEYFAGDQSSDPIISYTEDRDLWRFKLPSSKEINAAISSYSQDLITWDELARRLRHQDTELIIEGRAILRYQQKQAESLSKLWRLAEIGPYTVPVVNSPILQSEIGHILAKEFPFGAVWCRHSDGGFVYSLRSDNNIDVSQIAMLYGGGGHKNAAGFKIDHIITERNNDTENEDKIST